MNIAKKRCKRCGAILVGESIKRGRCSSCARFRGNIRKGILLGAGAGAGATVAAIATNKEKNKNDT